MPEITCQQCRFSRGDWMNEFTRAILICVKDKTEAPDTICSRFEEEKGAFIDMKALPMTREAQSCCRVIVEGSFKKSRPYVEPVKIAKPTRPPGPRMPTTVQVLGSLRNSGRAMSQLEISTDLGLTRSTVSEALRLLRESGEVKRLDAKVNKMYMFVASEGPSEESEVERHVMDQRR